MGESAVRVSVFVCIVLAVLQPWRPALGQTPEETRMWEEQRAKAQAEDKLRADRLAKQREARRADPMAWVRTLDPLNSGGWQFRAVATDGSWAVFSTEHQMKRSGHSVTAWLRQEYPEPQHAGNADFYLSDVQKVDYDCGKERARIELVIYYTQNNLMGSQQSEQADLKQAAWDAIVPGTQSETIFQWACKLGAAAR